MKEIVNSVPAPPIVNQANAIRSYASNTGYVIGGKIQNNIVFLEPIKFRSSQYRFVLINHLSKMNSYCGTGNGFSSVKEALDKFSDTGTFYLFNSFKEFAQWVVDNS